MLLDVALQFKAFYPPGIWIKIIEHRHYAWCEWLQEIPKIPFATFDDTLLLR